MSLAEHLRWWLTPSYARPERRHDTRWLVIVRLRYAGRQAIRALDAYVASLTATKENPR
jgi:hypothetical protein